MKHLVRMAIIGVLAALSSPIQSQTFDEPGQPHSVSMEVIYGKPYVMVTINGKGPFRFLVDTGTSGDAIISPELANQLDLPLAGEARLNDPTGMGGQHFPIRKMDTLRLAGMDFYAIKAIEHSLPDMDGVCQGLLGFTFFRDFLFTLDYIHGRLILAEGELTPDGERSVLPFSMPNGVPVARLHIGDRDIEAQIDSGAAGLSFPERLVPLFRFSAQPTDFARGQTLFARFDVKAARLASDVHLGDITLDQPWVEINSAFRLATFGSYPLEHFIVTFDQENNLVRFDGPSRRITLGVTPAPLRLTSQPGKPTDPALVPVG
jgi:hypothetical protein